MGNVIDLITRMRPRAAALVPGEQRNLLVALCLLNAYNDRGELDSALNQQVQLWGAMMLVRLDAAAAVETNLLGEDPRSGA